MPKCFSILSQWMEFPWAHSNERVTNHHSVQRPMPLFSRPCDNCPPPFTTLT